MIRLINYSLLQCFQPKEYQYYLTFLTFIQVRTDKNKFMQIRNVKTFDVLTYMQVRINKEWIGKNNLCEFLK